jgi:hypothetical protein
MVPLFADVYRGRFSQKSEPDLDARQTVRRPMRRCPAMQTRWMSFMEAVINIVVGYGLAVLAQIVVFPLFGLYASLSDNLLMGAAFTTISLARSYVLRRLFNAAGDVPVDVEIRSEVGVALLEP